MLQCNRKKKSFRNNANTWNVVWKKKFSLPPTSFILLVSQKYLVLMFHLQTLNGTEMLWNKFFSHTSNYSWVKEISRHWLDLPASSVSKHRNSNVALYPTKNKYVIYTEIWTSIRWFVSLCDEQTILKACEKQGIISVESIP